MNVFPGGPDSLLDDELFRYDQQERFERDLAAHRERTAGLKSGRSAPTPVATDDRSKNPLRPRTFSEMIGQDKAKRLLHRFTSSAKERDKPLAHVLLVAPSGIGKTTFAHVIANELGRQVYQLEAPISADTLLELREVMQDGDLLFIDEIHQQAIQERRGKSASTQPEVLFSVMEDFTIPTSSGVLPFPQITVMGATTDEGMLPDPFINRFPIRPRLTRYTPDEMKLIARLNSDQLGILMGGDAAEMFANASRGVPREMNNMVRNAADLCGPTEVVRKELAREVIVDLCGMTLDGLTADMQGVLTFLFTRCQRVTKGTGDITYQASVATIATAIGKSRDQKAVQLRIEPYLIERGYLQVGHGGRTLTGLGIGRARQLLEG